MKTTLILLLSMLLFTACKEKTATSNEPDKTGTPASVYKYTTKIPPAKHLHCYKPTSNFRA